jgi:type IV pilus assembly protein PilQ
MTNNKSQHPGRILYTAALSFLFIILFFGCAAEKAIEKDSLFEAWKIKAEKSKGYSPAPRKPDTSVIAHPLPVATDDTTGSGQQTAENLQQTTDDTQQSTDNEQQTVEKPLPTEKISLKMHDVDVAVLLRTLARAADQNIIISESVQGKANIDIKTSPWDQVFRSILSTYGLTYKWEGEIIRILSLKDMDQELKLLEISQRKESQKREFELVEPLVTRVIRIKYADIDALKENLEQFLTGTKDGKRGAVATNAHTRSLIIQSTQSDVEMMAALIEELDQPTLQVMIEAHIVETTQDVARELGIQWGGLYHHQDGDENYWITPGTYTGGETANNSVNPQSGMGVNFPANLEDGMGLSIGYVAQKLGKYILGVQLAALQKDGKLNILSSPSVTTLDNQTAMIESGKEVPFQTVEDGEVNIVFKKAVLSLEVTPHVIDGKTLKMNIKTHKDELDFSRTVQGNPSILTKNAETNVFLFDGQTTVIGGLSKESLSRTESGVPILKDIPVLGNLFKGKEKQNNMEEVLIFITPHILESIE